MLTSISSSLRDLGFGENAVCLHASLRSFDSSLRDPAQVVEAFLEVGCTLMVPTFSWGYAVQPSPTELLRRNAWRSPDYSRECRVSYSSRTAEVDRDMGAISATVAAWPARVRSDHPLCSFSAVGPLASTLLSSQALEDVWAPLDSLAVMGGSVILAGVGFEALTLLHLAERRAGRIAFRRWACVGDGRIVRVEVGGCSDGFAQLEGALASITRRVDVGGSLWLILPAAPALALAIAAIGSDPEITRCSSAVCERCADAIAGGPILHEMAS